MGDDVSKILLESQHFLLPFLSSFALLFLALFTWHRSFSLFHFNLFNLPYTVVPHSQEPPSPLHSWVTQVTSPFLSLQLPSSFLPHFLSWNLMPHFAFWSKTSSLCVSTLFQLKYFVGSLLFFPNFFWFNLFFPPAILSPVFNRAYCAPIVPGEKKKSSLFLKYHIRFCSIKKQWRDLPFYLCIACGVS